MGAKPQLSCPQNTQQAILRNVSQLAQNSMKSFRLKIQYAQKRGHPCQNRFTLLCGLCGCAHGVSPNQQGKYSKSDAYSKPRSGVSTCQLTLGQSVSHDLFPIAPLLPGSPHPDPGTWEPDNASRQSAHPWAAVQRRSYRRESNLTRIMARLNQLLPAVPVYLLSCNMEPEAATLAHQTLFS